MSAEDIRDKHKKIVRQFFEEVVNNECWDLVEEMFASRFVLQAPLFPSSPIEGRPDDVKKILKKICKAFPNIQVNVDEDLIAENGFVVARWTGTGRHEGEAIEASNETIEPTGDEVEFHGMTSFHFSADNEIDRASAVMVDMQWWEDPNRRDPERRSRRRCNWWRHCFH